MDQAKSPEEFDQSIRLKPLSECVSDPASVLYVDIEKSDITAQGTGIQKMMKTITSVGLSFSITDKEVEGQVVYVPECTITMLIFSRNGVLHQGEAAGFLDFGSEETDAARFYLDPLDAEHKDSYYFGAKCAEKMENGGKYYTSMYTSFPYECIDGVNAYYVDGIENGIVHCVPVPNNKVPSNTGVILECNTPNDPAHNRLIPLLSEPAKISRNLLKGVFFNYDGTGYNGAIRTPNRTAYDKNTMRVFSVSKTTGKIGFYQYSGSYLGANKAYLDYDFSNAHSNSFDGELTMNFDNTMSGVNEVHVEETVKDDRYYDLQGRVVEHPTRGIYIRNGRKVYVN